jgi:hypothetical protein
MKVAPWSRNVPVFRRCVTELESSTIGEIEFGDTVTLKIAAGDIRPYRGLFHHSEPITKDAGTRIGAFDVVNEPSVLDLFARKSLFPRQQADEFEDCFRRISLRSIDSLRGETGVAVAPPAAAKARSLASRTFRRLAAPVAFVITPPRYGFGSERLFARSCVKASMPRRHSPWARQRSI